MKKNPFFGYVLLVLVFLSCAGHSVFPPLSSIDPSVNQAIAQVKQNSPEIKKYFVLDENKDIIVKADIAGIQQASGKIVHLEVVYDLMHAAADGAGGFLVPFTVKNPETGEAAQEELFWKPQKDAAGILLSFDDDHSNVWERNFDLFDHYNARVTFFVLGEYSPFSLAAMERGHDVGYHSLHHLNLLKISRKIFHKETVSRINTFRNAGIPLAAFAYPYGLSESWMHRELLKYFKIVRGYGVTFRVYDNAHIRNSYISSRALDTILFKRDEDFKAVIDVMLRTVKFIGGDLILPLTTHDISDTALWGIKPQRLQYLLQSVNDLQLKFYLYRDFE